MHIKKKRKKNEHLSITGNIKGTQGKLKKMGKKTKQNIIKTGHPGLK